MDFFDENDNELSNNFIYLNQNTSDIMQQSNVNSTYILSKLSDFFYNKKISPEILNNFLFEINQRIIWENLLEFNDATVRQPFDLLANVQYNLTVPDDYADTMQEDSMIDALIKFLPRYFQRKYKNLDFSSINDIISSMQPFEISKYLLKLFTILETLLPMSLEKSIEEVMLMFGEISLLEKINKVKDKAYLGMLWNMTQSYLAKCDRDIYLTITSQSWEFVSDYIKNQL